MKTRDRRLKKKKRKKIVKRKRSRGTGRTKKKKVAWEGKKYILHLFACKLRVIKAPKKDVHVLGRGGAGQCKVAGQCNQ